MAGKGDKPRPTTPAERDRQRESHDRVFGVKEKTYDDPDFKKRHKKEVAESIAAFDKEHVVETHKLVKVEPTRNHLVVLSYPTEDTEEVTASGIVLDVTEERVGRYYDRGEVIAIGPLMITDDGTEMAINYDVGDTVMYSNYMGKLIDKDRATGRELSILSMTEILGKEIN